MARLGVLCNQNVVRGRLRMRVQLRRRQGWRIGTMGWLKDSLLNVETTRLGCIRRWIGGNGGGVYKFRKDE